MSPDTIGCLVLLAVAALIALWSIAAGRCGARLEAATDRDYQATTGDDLHDMYTAAYAAQAARRIDVERWLENKGSDS